MQGERAESESKVGQKPNRDAEIQYILLFNEVINKTNKVKEGEKIHLTR